MGFILLYENHIFMSRLKIMKMNYYCPRCHTTEISEYKETFECTKCLDNSGHPLEFEKRFIGKVPDDEVLARQEMASFVDTFDELRDSEKRKKFFESLSEDDFES